MSNLTPDPFNEMLALDEDGVLHRKTILAHGDEFIDIGFHPVES